VLQDLFLGIVLDNEVRDESDDKKADPKEKDEDQIKFDRQLHFIEQITSDHALKGLRFTRVP